MHGFLGPTVQWLCVCGRVVQPDFDQVGVDVVAPQGFQQGAPQFQVGLLAHAQRRFLCMRIDRDRRVLF